MRRFQGSNMGNRFLQSLSLCVMLGVGVVANCPLYGQDKPNPLPWDYDPYRVMIWVAGASPEMLENEWKPATLASLDRDFAAIWRTEMQVAPNELTAVAKRDFAGIDYGLLTADDPVVVMKRDHVNAAKVRLPTDVATNIENILCESVHRQATLERAQTAGNADLHGMSSKLTPIDGDLLKLQSMWQAKETEAILLPRGMALGLKPQPKFVELTVANRMGNLFANYDKLFLVLVDHGTMESRLVVREFDCLMRHPGPIHVANIADPSAIPNTMARLITNAFAPLVRIDDVGDKSAEGRLRAGGLVLDPQSPAAVQKGDFVQPFLRKNDRAGEPLLVGVVDWTYFLATEQSDAKLKFEMHSGRSGALKGRRNARTIRAALKIRPTLPATTLRLHAKGDAKQPLVGYDVYEKDRTSGSYTFVGQTDWDGRLLLEKTASPLRLLYVKNGGAVLARLPIVPGQTALEVADLVGDDIRLQAEAYIRGVQNSIIDLVAIRTLFASSIRAHIKKGNFPKAIEQLDRLRQEPTYEKLANDMAVKQTMITSRNRSEQRKIDSMFADTRTLLVKHINPTIVRELEAELTAAGGSPIPAANNPATPPSPPDNEPTAPTPPAQ